MKKKVKNMEVFPYGIEVEVLGFFIKIHTKSPETQKCTPIITIHVKSQKPPPESQKPLPKSQRSMPNH